MEGLDWEMTDLILLHTTHFFRDFAKPVKTDLKFDWPRLSLPTIWREELEAPFTLQETNDAIFGSHADGALGPNGLPMHFYSKNWDSISEDLAGMFWEFHAGGRPTPINYSWIVFIPKAEGAAPSGDFRSISLANCVCKILSKVLVNRLKEIVGEMVGPSQAVFIRGISILDSIAVAEEVISHLKEGDNEGLLVKVDFKKVFDILDLDFLLANLEARGFGTNSGDGLRNA